MTYLHLAGQPSPATPTRSPEEMHDIAERLTKAAHQRGGSL